MIGDLSISIILPVHDQQSIIGRIIQSILKNSSDNVKEFFIILDGCTDNSEQVILENLINVPKQMTIKLFYTPDIWETKCCNFGFKKSTCQYCLNIQDDMEIQQPNFDQFLLEPFSKFSNILAVSGRDAVDCRILNGKLDYYNCGGKDVNTLQNVFSIRDAVNRGPLLLDNEKLQELNYLDELFAPLDSDDVDLSLRGYKEKGYLVGSRTVNYFSPLAWGKTRSNFTSNRIWEASMIKNHKIIIERHKEYLLSNVKHSQDIILE